MNKKLLTISSFVVLVATLLVSRGIGSPSAAHADTPTPTPTATSTPAPIVITVSPLTSVLSCGNSTQVTVNVKQGGVNVADGTSVQLGATQGSLNQAIVLTAGGNAVFTYFAPQPFTNFNGGVNLTASALSTTANASLTIFCGSTPPPGPPVQFVPPAVLNQPGVTCQGATASVVFSWIPAPIVPVPGVTIAYLDLSLQNNNFAPGTFLSAGPLDVTINQIVWNGILTGQTTYWRVNTLTNGNGWTTSATGSFTPCGNPAPVNQVTYFCTGGGTASVTFNWGQPAAGFNNYLDITLFNNGFAPGTFIGTPVSGTSFTWNGILANLPTYWRMNSLLQTGWVQVAGGSFIAAC